jgi:AraC-like DNA-binding protein
MGFQQWRLRACIVNAISRLALGHSVTVIAYDLGYERPAAFSTMFRKMTGHVPSAHPAALGPRSRVKKAGHFAPANHSARDAEETIG